MFLSLVAQKRSFITEAAIWSNHNTTKYEPTICTNETFEEEFIDIS